MSLNQPAHRVPLSKLMYNQSLQLIFCTWAEAA